MANAERDGNRVPALIGVSSSDGATPITVYTDPTTHRLYVDASITVGFGSQDGITDNQAVSAALKGVLALGTDGSNYQVLAVNSSGHLLVDLQDTSIAVTGTFWQATQPVSIAAAVAVTQSGTWDEVGINDSGNSITVDAPQGTPVFVRLSDGTNPIATLPVSLASVPSHAVTNAGTFVIQENGSALTALQLIDDVVYVDDADWTGDSSKHVLVGGLYQSTPQTVTDGDVAPFEIDANGNLKDTLATLISGEDQTNDVMKVEEQFSYAYLTADGQVKATAGFIHTITISPTDAAATAGTIILYDQTTEAAPAFFTYYVPAAALVPVTLTLDVKFLTALYVGFTTTADVAVTISYR